MRKIFDFVIISSFDILAQKQEDQTNDRLPLDRNRLHSSRVFRQFLAFVDFFHHRRLHSLVADLVA